METELKIFNLAFRPLSDEDEQDVDMGDNDLEELDEDEEDGDEADEEEEEESGFGGTEE